MERKTRAEILTQSGDLMSSPPLLRAFMAKAVCGSGERMNESGKSVSVIYFFWEEVECGGKRRR